MSLRRGIEYTTLFERDQDQEAFDRAWQDGLEESALDAYKRFATYRNGLKAAAEVAYLAGLAAGRQENQQKTE